MADSVLTPSQTRRGFSVRKLADKSRGVEEYDHVTRETRFVNPGGGPWPFAGLMFQEPPPKLAIIPMSWVSRGKHEGWIDTEGDRVTRAKGAPPAGQGEHVFFNADFIIIKDTEGPTRYKVTHQPGKYPDGNMDRVDWFFEAELVSRG